MKIHELVSRNTSPIAQSILPKVSANKCFFRFQKFTPTEKHKKLSIEGFLTTIISLVIVVLWGSTAFAQGDAYKALKQQAYNGNVSSQVKLGIAHLRVENSTMDRKIGLAWLIVAASEGDSRAIQIRDRAFSIVSKVTGQDAERIAFQVRHNIEERQNGKRNQASAKATDIVLLSGIGSAEALKELIKEGADVDVATKDGTTPLLAAFLSRRFDLAKILLTAGADPEIAGSSGKPLLVEMVEQENLPAVALLKANGASVFTHDVSGAPVFQSERVSDRLKPLLAIEVRDMTRDEVREVQARLTAAGYEPGPVDGLLGRKTWAAFAVLSRDKGFALVGRNPNAVLQAARTYVPTAEFREEIGKAIRSNVKAERVRPSPPKEPKKTNAQIFFAGSLSN